MRATADVRARFGGSRRREEGVYMVRARRVPRRSVLSAAVGVLVAAAALVAPVSTADTSPDAGTPATVSNDALPTWQVNGVVWSQVTVRNIVYATGSFTKARPPGVAEGGRGEIAARNIFAYDIRTGARVKTFRHGLNAQRTGRRRLAGSSSGVCRRGLHQGRRAIAQTPGGVRHLRRARSSDVRPSADAPGPGAGRELTERLHGRILHHLDGRVRRRLAAVGLSGGLKSWAPTTRRPCRPWC